MGEAGNEMHSDYSKAPWIGIGLSGKEPNASEQDSLILTLGQGENEQEKPLR
jgi:hypothetical protein